MRFKTMGVFAALGSIMVGSFVVYGRAMIERTMESPQKDVVHFICPPKIEAGPANIPDGWQSLGNPSYQRRSISVDIQKHLVVCWYGEGKPFPPYLIAKPIPSGYVCKVLEQEDTSFANFEAECRLSRRRR